MTLKELKSHVTVTRNGCWEWNRGKTGDGYGALREGDKIRYAHIKAYELANGAVPKDFVVDHKCRNRKCVNPAHLKAKTRGDNSTTNSDSPTAKNKAKKVCMNGHPLTGDNLYTMPDGRRQCRKCQNARIAAWRKKNPRIQKHLQGQHDQREHAWNAGTSKKPAMKTGIPRSIANAKNGEVVRVPLRDLDGLKSKWGFRLMQHERTKALANRIMREGFTEPIVIYTYKDGQAFIRDGQHRAEAAFKLGMRNVPAKVVHRPFAPRGPVVSQEGMSIRRKLARRETPEKRTKPFEVNPLLPHVNRVNNLISRASVERREEGEKALIGNKRVYSFASAFNKGKEEANQACERDKEQCKILTEGINRWIEHGGVTQLRSLLDQPYANRESPDFIVKKIKEKFKEKKELAKSDSLLYLHRVMRAAPNNAPQLYRGMRRPISLEQAQQVYAKGSVFDTPVSSWTDNPEVAEEFTNTYWWRKKQMQGTPVIFRVKGGSKALNIGAKSKFDSEWISQGRFTITGQEVKEQKVKGAPPGLKQKVLYVDLEHNNQRVYKAGSTLADAAWWPLVVPHIEWANL